VLEGHDGDDQADDERDGADPDLPQAVAAQDSGGQRALCGARSRVAGAGRCGIEHCRGGVGLRGCHDISPFAWRGLRPH
jgi:hypothetical protein